MEESLVKSEFWTTWDNGPLVVENQRVSAGPPSVEVLLTADVGGARVQNASQPALDTRTSSMRGAPQQHFVDAWHSVRFRIAVSTPEEMLKTNISKVLDGSLDALGWMIGCKGSIHNPINLMIQSNHFLIAISRRELCNEGQQFKMDEFRLISTNVIESTCHTFKLRVPVLASRPRMVTHRSLVMTESCSQFSSWTYADMVR